jgi:hypothetical protein
MKSLKEIFRETGAYKTPECIKILEALFEPFRFERVALLELGVFQGGSLRGWAEYFPYGVIAGVDLQVPELPEHDRVRVYAADQADVSALSRVATEVAPNGFDIVIDDCSHIARLAKVSFWHLFNNHLKAGGLYLIEDWPTGYWPWWPDGRALAPEPDTKRRMPNHDAGMVGLLKQLIDQFHEHSSELTKEQLPAVLHQWLTGTMEEPKSKFVSMTVYPGICAIRKA